MTTIHKFTLTGNTCRSQVVHLPFDARILSFQVQAGALVFWAIRDTEQTPRPRYFRLYFTGAQLPENPGTYISTVWDGKLVWHLFEVTT